MNKQYRYEKFESRDECLIWCADNKPMCKGKLILATKYLSTHAINDHWQECQKAIDITPEKRVVEEWVNVYPSHTSGGYTSKSSAMRRASSNCMGTVKLTKEITIIDGKVVDE